jgi:hypothetical protein
MTGFRGQAMRLYKNKKPLEVPVLTEQIQWPKSVIGQAMFIRPSLKRQVTVKQAGCR